jgi:hypothetical protein
MRQINLDALGGIIVADYCPDADATLTYLRSRFSRTRADERPPRRMPDLKEENIPVFRCGNPVLPFATAVACGPDLPSDGIRNWPFNLRETDSSVRCNI